MDIKEIEENELMAAVWNKVRGLNDNIIKLKPLEIKEQQTG